MTIFQTSDVIRRNKYILAHAWKLEDVIVNVAFSEVVYSFCTILCGMFCNYTQLSNSVFLFNKHNGGKLTCMQF